MNAILGLRQFFCEEALRRRGVWRRPLCGKRVFSSLRSRLSHPDVMILGRIEQLKLLGLNDCFGAPVDF